MDIKRVHEINLILLKEIDRICKKYKIKYRLEAGTFLGAVRHKGFIPWDDDCDVAFLRDEYEKFKIALKKEKLKKGLKYVKASSNKNNFHDFVDRIFYTKEVYRDGKEYDDRFGGYYRYLWVDIFVLDNLDEGNEKNTFLQQKIIYGKALGHRHEANYTKYKGILLNIAAFALSTIGKFKNLSDIYKLHEDLSMKDRHKVTKYVYYSNYPIIWMGYKTERADEEKIIYRKFMDTKLPILKNYDKILKYLYGNYKKLPPKEKRIPEHKNNIW